MRYVNLTFFFVSFSPMFSLFSFHFFVVGESRTMWMNRMQHFGLGLRVINFLIIETQKWSKKKKQKTFFNFYCFSFFEIFSNSLPLCTHFQFKNIGSGQQRMAAVAQQFTDPTKVAECAVWCRTHITTYCCPCERFPQLFVFFLSFYFTILMDSKILRNNSLSSLTENRQIVGGGRGNCDQRRRVVSVIFCRYRSVESSYIYT